MKLRITAPLMTVMVVGAITLSGCSSDTEPSSEPVPAASQSASPTEGAADSSPSAAPTTGTVPEGFNEPEVMVDPSKAPDVNSPTYVKNENLFAWPKEDPKYKAELLKEFTADEITQAWKEMVVFADTVGWNQSLMAPGADEELVYAALLPYLSDYAMKQVKYAMPNYLKVNEEIANGLDVRDYYLSGKKLSKKEQEKFDHWIAISAIASNNVPYLDGADQITIGADGQPAFGGFEYDIYDIWTAPSAPGYLYVKATFKKHFPVKDAAHAEDGLLDVYKVVTFALKKNDAEFAETGIPWIIETWQTESVMNENLNVAKPQIEQGVLSPGI